MEETQSLFEGLRIAYKKNEMIINIVVRFCVYLFVYMSILKSDYDYTMFGFLSSFFMVVITSIALSALTVIAPARVGLFLLISAVCISISNAFGLMIIGSSVLIAIFILFASINDSIAKVILFTICCFYLKIPYLAPMYIGIKTKNRNLFPVLIGTSIFYVIMALNNGLIEMNQMSEFPDLFGQMLYTGTTLLAFILGSSTFLFMVISFIITILVCNIIKLSGSTNNREMAIIVAGVIFVIVGIICSMVGGNVNVLRLIPSLIISMIIVYILSIFDSILDYNKAEKVFFQDENNTYYVKIVPKIK